MLPLSRNHPASIAYRIDSMMHTRADLLSQVATLETAISCAKLEYRQAINMLAPVSSVPNELLSTIFQAGYESSSFPFEITVSQITRLWRHVATTTPQLWTRIHVGGSGWHSMAETYLSRSGALTLDLHIDMHSVHTSMEDIILACRIFHSGASRWRRLNVCIIWWDGLARLLESLASASVPSLHSVRISFDNVFPDADDGDADTITRSIFTGGAPSLTSLKLHGLRLDCCLPPLTMMNTLEIHKLFPGDKISLACLASMLDGLPLLAHLVINGDFIHNWTPNIQIKLPSLRSFHLCTYCDIEQIPGLLNAIAAPLLHTLLLESVISDEINAFAESQSTLQTPKYPSLRSLALFTDLTEQIRADAWTNIFRVFPSVTHFSLSNWDWELFSRSLLKPEKPDFPRWPELDTVSVVAGVAFPTFLRETIPVLIASGHPIRTLQLSQTMITNMSDDDLTHLRTQVEVTENTLYDISPFVRWFADDD